nr:CDP-glycerol glycerophosphotransferase family protein [Candidatus Microthrix sp.]
MPTRCLSDGSSYSSTDGTSTSSPTVTRPRFGEGHSRRPRHPEYGYPRNDALINPNHKVREETRTRLGVPEGNLAMLYTPTHRDGVGQFDLGLDAAAFIRRVGDNITLLIRGHYFYDPSDRLEGLVDTGRIIDVSDDVEIEPLYLAADAHDLRLLLRNVRLRQPRPPHRDLRI